MNGSARRYDALFVGVVGVVVGAVGSGRPSLWYDEVATVRSATRSTADLTALLANQDAVHGLYYWLMHHWFAVFGVSPAAARFPSALAVGVAAAGVVVLGARLGGRRLGLVSGLLFVAVPQVTWAAVEARSFALSAAVAVWLTVLLLVAAAARPGRRVIAWAAYGLVVVVAVLTLVYLAALVVAHAVTLALRRSSGRAWLGWAVASAVGAAVTVPFALQVMDQAGQVAWIPPLSRHVVSAVAVDQWFDGATLFAAAAAVVVVAGVVLRRDAMPGVLGTVLPWLLVPTALLLSYSALVTPLYVPRYLAFTLPAVALLLGWAVCQVSTSRAVVVAVVAAFAVLAAPTYVAQRGTYAKPSGMDFTTVNRFAAGHVRAGDCVLFGSADWNPASQRLASDADPSAFAGARDIALGPRADEQAWLWDGDRPEAETAAELPGCDVLWYVTDRDRDRPETVRHSSNEVWVLGPYSFDTDPWAAEFAHAGLRVEDRWAFNRSQVVLLERR